MKALLSRPLLWAVLILVASVAAFTPGASGGFLFDDYPNIVSNPRVHAEALDAESLARAAKAYEQGGSGRSLSTISFAANHAFGGLDPRGYKLTNIGLHALNALLVFALVLQLLRKAGPESLNPVVAAGVVALYWALHPLQVSTVLYIVQRMEMLAATFILSSLWCYMRGRQQQLAGEPAWTWLLAAALLAAMGMAGKETALLTPVYALAIEVTLFGFAAAEARTARLLRTGWLLAVVGALALYFLVVLPRFLDPEIYALRDYTLVERLLTQLRVLPTYLGWMLLPTPDSLTFYYDNYEVSRGLFSPVSTAIGGLFLLGLLAVALLTRRRVPLLALAIFWFFASHVLTSNVMPFELVFEHRNYLALLAPFLAGCVLVAWLARRGLPDLARLGPPLVLTGLAALCVVRAASWGDVLLLSMHNVAVNRDSPRASNDLGEQYFLMSGGNPDSPFFQFARKEFERGSLLPGSSPLPEQALIIISARAGQPADPIWWDRIEEKLRTRPIGPQEGMAILGLMRRRQDGMTIDDRRLSQALDVLFERGKLPPSSYAEYGDYALTVLNRPDLATRLFVDAVSVPPRDPAYGRKILRVLEESGHEEQARAVRQRLMELGDLPPAG